MPAPTEFGFEQLLPELLRGFADAVADRPGDTEAQRFARQQTAIFSVMALLPRDAMEAMLAGQCVMLDHLLRDATRDLLRSEAGPGKLRIRSQLTALGRSFLKHLEQLRLLQARQAQQTSAPPNTEAQPEPDPNSQSAEAAKVQTAGTVAGSPAATAEPVQPQLVGLAPGQACVASPAPATQQGGKADRLLQHGFQNRRMRRALQFKTPANQPVRQGPSQSSTRLQVAARSATGSRSSGG